MGYSLRAGVALQTAFRHPALVRRLVIVSRPIKRSAFYPEVIRAFDQMGPQTGTMRRQSPLYKMYPDVNWETLFAHYNLLMTDAVGRFVAPFLSGTP